MKTVKQYLRLPVVVFLLILTVGALIIWAPISVKADTSFTKEEQEKIQTIKKRYELIKKQNYFLEYEAMFNTVPLNNEEPYNPGETTDEYQKYAEEYVNFIRFINDLPETKISKKESTSAQSAAAALSGINKGLSHDLADAFIKPNYITAQEWENACVGAKKSNLGSIPDGINSVARPINNWLEDSGPDNKGVGHRSWILDYNLNDFGLGSSRSTNGITYSAMKVNTDTYSVKNPNGWITEWPRQGVFPINFLNSGYRWSTHFSSSDYNFKDNVKVILKKNNTNETWEFSNSTADGEFYISEQDFSNDKIIMFRPDNIKYSVNDSFTVKITGISGAKTSYEYTVKLFELDEREPLKLESFNLFRKEVTINVGEWYYPQLVFSPTNASAQEKQYKWESKSNSILQTSIISNAVLGKGVGTDTVTYTTNDGRLKAVLTVHVVNNAATNITVNPSNVTLTVGDEKPIAAVISPSNAADKSITWSTNNPAVAAVSNTGIITAKAAGTATITSETSNGKKADVKVTVIDIIDDHGDTREDATIFELNKTYTGEISDNKDIDYFYRKIESGQKLVIITNKELKWVGLSNSASAGKGFTKSERDGLFYYGTLNSAGDDFINLSFYFSGIAGDKYEFRVIPYLVNPVEVERTSYDIYVGETIQVSAKINNGVVSSPNFYCVGTTGYASVDKEGKVTGIKAGTQLIQAGDPISGKSSSNIKINVYDSKTIKGKINELFPDADLAAYLAKSLSKSVDDVVSQADLDKIVTISLSKNTSPKAVLDLTGTENLRKLKTMTIQYYQIKNLSSIVSLESLTNLSLNWGSLTQDDITVLSKLKQLQMLSLRDNNALDISCLSSLVALNNFELCGSKISNDNLKVISRLTNLNTLYIVSNMITDVSSISTLNNLNKLTIDTINLVDLTPLSKLEGLTYLSVRSNKMEDITPISKLTKLTTLYVNGNNAQGKSKLTNLTSLSKLTNLSYLSLYGLTSVTNISFVSKLTSLGTLDLRYTAVEDLTPLNSMTSLKNIYK